MGEFDGIDRAARHLIATFGDGALKVAEHRAQSAAGTNGTGIYGQTWLVIGNRVRELQRPASST